MYIMRNNEKTYKVNLTHIATSYPETVDLTDSQHHSLTFKHLANDGVMLSTPLQDEVLNMILSKALGDDWAEQYFFDTISHIKI